MAAGLEQALDFLENAQFSSEDIAWLRQTGRFGEQLLDYLASFRFTGDVHAMPEGTVFFGNEPMIRVTAPLPQAQLVETRIMNIVHFQSVIASKAARVKLAAPDKLLVDFGLRRAHGAEAGLMRRGRATSPGLPALRRYWPKRCLASPLSAPWLTPSSKLTMTKALHSKSSHFRGLIT